MFKCLYLWSKFAALCLKPPRHFRDYITHFSERAFFCFYFHKALESCITPKTCITLYTSGFLAMENSVKSLRSASIKIVGAFGGFTGLHFMPLVSSKIFAYLDRWDDGDFCCVFNVSFSKSYFMLCYFYSVVVFNLILDVASLEWTSHTLNAAFVIGIPVTSGIIIYILVS